MPNTFAISGIIGIDVEPAEVRDFLNEFKDEDVVIEIAGPGGFVMPALEIFNLIRNHNGKTTARLMGQAASADAFIPMAFDEVEVFDNTIFMIHNVLSFVIGNKNDLRDAAERFDRLDNLLANAFVNKSGRNKTEIMIEMDEETFFFGDEILKAGFADRVIQGGNQEDIDKETAIIVVREAVENCRLKMKESGQAKDDLARASAFVSNFHTLLNTESVKPVKLVNKIEKIKKSPKNKEGTMESLETLLAENPGAKEEFVGACATAREKGIQSIQAIAAKMAPVMSSAVYPVEIKTLGLDVIQGKADHSAFTAVVTTWDMSEEGKAAKAAAALTEVNPETPPVASSTATNTTGNIKSAEDVPSAVDDMRRLQGLSPKYTGGEK